VAIQVQRQQVLGFGLALGAYAYFAPRTVTGWVNGQPQRILIRRIGNGHWLRSDAAIAFKAMRRAAKKDGVELGINSAFRRYSEQAVLWLKYQAGTGNLAAKPGYSNHQGGVAVDIPVAANPKALAWLRANAHRFGFYATVASEPWHWVFKG
jgi:LAS superfamily LD-carboxypeptidase LdcB